MSRVGLFIVVLGVTVSVVVGGASASSRSQATTTTVTLSTVADTYVRSGASDTNEGSSTFLRLRASGDNRALVRFDQNAIVEAVGSGSLVSASLVLTISTNGDNWGSTGRTISAYRLTSPWTEGNGFVDHGTPANRGTGTGATWNCATDANIANQARDCSGQTEWEMGKPSQPQLHPWLEPATATRLITNGLSGTVSLDVTADVDAFLDGTANNGWILKKDLEGPSGLVEFASRELGGGPQLELHIEVPADVTPPGVSTSGEFSDLDGNAAGAPLSYVQTVSSNDGESGVSRVWVERVGGPELAASAAVCSPSCPPTYSAALTIDPAVLSEGQQTFVAKSVDGAGNVSATQSWSVTIDHVPPIEVDFDAPVTVAEALAYAEEQGFRPTELVSQLADGGETWTLFYVVSPNATNNDILSDTPSGLFADLAVEGVDLSSIYTPDPPVVAMIAETAPETNGRSSPPSSRSGSNWNSRWRSGTSTATSSYSSPGNGPPSCVGPWIPSFGRIATRPSLEPETIFGVVVPIRYVHQRFGWDSQNLARLKCDDDVTYEPDAVYYKVDGQYLGEYVGWSSISNLPAAYLDTRRFGEDCCDVYTIGTQDADQLVANHAYITHIRTTFGSQPVDHGVPRAQIGYHVGPNGLCSRFAATWCIVSRKSDASSGRPNEIDLLNTISNGPPKPPPIPALYEHAVPGTDAWPQCQCD